MKHKLTSLTLGLALGVPLFGHALAAPPQCGPLSQWTGQVCIGPKGKAYCPADMTMSGNTCLSTASSGASSATPLARLSVDTDHARIIQMLTALTNQVTQQGAVINDLQQKLIAMQIVLNLNTSNIDKAKVAASNAEAGVTGLQASTASILASTASLATNVSSLQANSSAVAGKVSAVQSEVTSVQNAQSAQDASIKDMSRRVLFTCLMATGIYAPLDPPKLNKNACTSTWWPQGTWNFDNPFGGN